MRLRSCIAIGLLVAGTVTAARAEVIVTFDHPETYTDAALYGDLGPGARDPALQGIRRHLEQLGARYLGAGQKLKVDVLDLDLAGRFEPIRPLAHDTRILRDITWPRVTLRYTLEVDGVIRAADMVTLADQRYRARPSVYQPNDPLRYEKAMLDDWFRARFVEPRPAAR
jgi:hypothetical protein